MAGICFAPSLSFLVFYIFLVFFLGQMSCSIGWDNVNTLSEAIGSLTQVILFWVDLATRWHHLHFIALLASSFEIWYLHRPESNQGGSIT